MEMNTEGNNNNNNNNHEKKGVRAQEQHLNCPRCNSTNTKFCYYNNYSLTQPRYFCKTCRRYWTEGGSLRNVPVGGGSRKNKNKLFTTSSNPNSSSSSKVTTVPSSSGINPKLLMQGGQDLNLAFPPMMNLDNYALPSSSTSSTSALELLRAGMASNNSHFVHQNPILMMPNSGFSPIMHDVKPAATSLGFSVLDNHHNGGGKLLFPFGDHHHDLVKKIIPGDNEVEENNKEHAASSGNNNNNSSSSGYWTGMIEGSCCKFVPKNFLSYTSLGKF